MATQPIDINGTIGRFAQYRIAGGENPQSAGEVIQCDVNGYVGQYFAASTVTNYVPSTGGSNGSNGGEASYGFDCYNFINNRGVAKEGALVGIQGLTTGDQSFSIGVSGVAASHTSNVKLIGVTGVAGPYQQGSIGVGVYAGINGNSDASTEVKPESCALLADNRSTGQPIFIGRRKNTEKMLVLYDNGSIDFTPPPGSDKARIRFGVSGSNLILEINDQKYSVKLSRI